jgi:hypothetical protein
MTPSIAVLEEPVLNERDLRAEASHTAFRLFPIMRQGTPSSIPETWTRFGSLDAARSAIKQMYRDDRVLRAFIVKDTVPPQFVEWVER